MITEEDIRARYKTVEKEADEVGRIISVRRLRPSEQQKLIGMTLDLEGYDEVEGKNDAGEYVKFQLPRRATHLVAAAVCGINDGAIAFPRNRAELDSVFDRLDAEGIGAASRALARLTSKIELPADQLDAAKN
jgi:hypothetical protein